MKLPIDAGIVMILRRLTPTFTYRRSAQNCVFRPCTVDCNNPTGDLNNGNRNCRLLAAAIMPGLRSTPDAEGRRGQPEHRRHRGV